VLLALALTLLAGQYAAAEVSKEELKSISTPDSVKTSIGTLKFFDGVPTDDTVKTVYDNLDRMRGVQVFLNTLGAASVYQLRAGILGRDAVRHPDPLAAADQQSLTDPGQPGQGAEEERRRLVRPLLWPETAPGQREQLARNRSGKELVHHPADIWPARALDQEDLAPE
jgi:hypothetical protein